MSPVDLSKLSKFYKKTKSEKIDSLLQAGVISKEDATLLSENGLELPDEIAGNMIENQIDRYSLPYGVAFHFLIDGKDYAVPMAMEEPSVVAAASFAAKIIREAGGFRTSLTDRRMIGQVALKSVPDVQKAIQNIEQHTEEVLSRANEAHPSIVKRGGGAREVHVRLLEADTIEDTPEFLVVHLHIETLEAMGANIVNTMMEGIAPYLEELTGGTTLMRILSNYATECLATAECRIPTRLLKHGSFTGEEVRDRMIEAGHFAWADPYRAVTHNKGIMNGVDAVVLASGNDWRAIEAGAHAYAAKSGQYRALSRWKKGENGELVGTLTLPLPVGAVGGSIGIHPAAQFTKRLLGYESAAELERIIVSVGLAQNFAAMRALVTEGIQKGHMGLQARSLAISAGAKGADIDKVVNQLKEAPNMNLATAKDILENLEN